MKKNEYVAPEMEIVEMTEQCNILAGSGGVDNGGDYGWGNGEDSDDHDPDD